MSLLIPVEDLRNKLQLCQAVLEEKGLLDFTGNVVFHENKIYAGNDKLVVMGPAPFDFDFSVNGKDLNTVLDGIGENAAFSLKDGKIHVKSGKVQAKLSCANIDTPLTWLKESGLNKVPSWKSLPKDFIQALDWCKFSASKDVSHKPGTCLKVLNDRVLSTDHYRISRYFLEEDMEITALIPKEAVPILSSFPDLSQFDKISESWILFRNPETEMICGVRLVIGDLPEQIEAILEAKGVEVKLPEKMKDLIKRSGKFVEGISEEAKVIDITIKKNEIICIGNKTTGFFQQKEVIEYDGPEMSFLVTPALFEQILDKIQTVILGEGTLSFKVGPFHHLMAVKSVNGKEEE
jgi:hypothetical protein